MPSNPKWCLICHSSHGGPRCKAATAVAESMLEKDIEKRVCDHAKSLGMLVYKFTSPACRSVPDRMFIPKGKSVFFIEFKRKNQTPTEAQKIEIQKIRSKRVQVFIIDEVEQGKKLINRLAKGLTCMPTEKLAAGFLSFDLSEF